MTWESQKACEQVNSYNLHGGKESQFRNSTKDADCHKRPGGQVESPKGPVKGHSGPGNKAHNPEDINSLVGWWNDLGSSTSSVIPDNNKAGMVEAACISWLAKGAKRGPLQFLLHNSCSEHSSTSLVRGGTVRVGQELQLQRKLLSNS